MALELSDFLKLPKHKPNNYVIGPEYDTILDYLPDLNYIIWMCSLTDELLLIYMNNDAQVMFTIFIKMLNGRLNKCYKYTLRNDIYSDNCVKDINIIFHKTIKCNIDSILDIPVNISNIKKCLHDVDIIDVLSNIISSYVPFGVSLYDIHSPSTKIRIFNSKYILSNSSINI